MPRSLSAVARAAVFAQEGGAAVFLALLDIVGPGMPTIRVVNDMQPLTHGGNVYQACAFLITLPSEQSDEPPEVRLRIDNVDQAIVEGVRLLTGPPTVTLTIVLAGSPDVVEAGPFDFTLRSAEFTAEEVVGTLAYQDILNESYPTAAFTPANFPNLFRDTAEAA